MACLLNGQNPLSVTKVICRQSLSAIQKKKRKKKKQRNAPVKKGDVDVSVVVKRSNLLCDFAGISRTFFLWRYMFLDQKICFKNVFFLLLQDLPNVPLGKKFLVKLIFAEFIFAFQYPQNSLHCGANLCKFSPVFVHLYFQTATVSTLV